MIDSWPLITLIYTFIAAAYMMTNDVFKQDGEVAVFWRSLFGAILILPVCLFADWPSDPGFYVIAFIASALFGIGDIIMFQAFKEHGGSVITRLSAFRPVMLFFMWPFFMPHSLDALFDAPVIGLGILACLLVIAIAVFTARNNHVGRAAFVAFLPCLFLFNFGDIGMKIAANMADGWSKAPIFALIICITMTIVSAIHMMARHKRIKVPERVFLTGGINAVLFLLLVSSKTIGLALAPSPAYFGALGMAMSVWTWLAHRYILRKEDNASPRAGFIVVACAALLTILVEMLPK